MQLWAGKGAETPEQLPSTLTPLEGTPLHPWEESPGPSSFLVLSQPPLCWLLCRLVKTCLMPENVLVPVTWRRWLNSSRCEQGGAAAQGLYVMRGSHTA